MPRFMILTLVFLIVCFPASLVFATDYTDPITGMEFERIKGGRYLMGDPTGQDKEASPAHEVTVDDFFMGKYEATFAQYDLFCEATDREKPDDAGWGRNDRPVINVDWRDAVAFTQWLSQKTGKVFRLPSESEWEYAVRGGTTTVYWWGDEWQEEMGVCRECGTQWDGQQTAPVGAFKPNPYGLYDMTGNVYEWCLDHKHGNYTGAPSTAEPLTDGGQPRMRIARGGSWDNSSRDLRSFARCWDNVDYKDTDTGFRIVMVLN